MHALRHTNPHRHTHIRPCRVCEGVTECCVSHHLLEWGEGTSRQNLSIKLKDQQSNVTTHGQQLATNKHQCAHTQSQATSNVRILTNLNKRIQNCQTMCVAVK